MKRSEMINKIGSKIYLELGPRIGDLNTAQKLAELLLKDMEELGMRPPRLPEEDCQAILSVYYAGYSLNQWEEDAVKDEKVMEAKARRAEARQRRLNRVQKT